MSLSLFEDDDSCLDVLEWVFAPAISRAVVLAQSCQLRRLASSWLRFAHINSVGWVCDCKPPRPASQFEVELLLVGEANRVPLPGERAVVMALELTRARQTTAAAGHSAPA